MTGVCEWYRVEQGTRRDGRPDIEPGPICLRPCTGTRCAEHDGMVTGRDRLEQADAAVDLVARLRARMTYDAERTDDARRR